jgi:hypothetical protein
LESHDRSPLGITQLLTVTQLPATATAENFAIHPHLWATAHIDEREFFVVQEAVDEDSEFGSPLHLVPRASQRHRFRNGIAHNTAPGCDDQKPQAQETNAKLLADNQYVTVSLQ